jgi:hypothetical protein
MVMASPASRVVASQALSYLPPAVVRAHPILADLTAGDAVAHTPAVAPAEVVAPASRLRYVDAWARDRQQGFKSMRKGWLIIVITFFASLLAAALTVAPSDAQTPSMTERYIWNKDAVTGQDIALSLNDQPINYIIVGDLSYYSIYLVQALLHMLSDSSGRTIDRNFKQYSLIAVHDTNVFVRLRNDKRSFGALGIPEFMVDSIAAKIPADAKCSYSTFSDSGHDLNATIIMLSEKFDDCLTQGIFHGFGILTKDASASALLDTCVLYEGRRLSIRERDSLDRERTRLIDLCVKKMQAQNSP